MNYKVALGILAIGLLVGCGKDEDEKSDEAFAEEEPTLIPIEDLSEGDSANNETGPGSQVDDVEAQVEDNFDQQENEAEEVLNNFENQAFDQVPPLLESGPIVIQVGVGASESAAQRLANTFEGQGINTYLAEVQDPGELEGTYYRVRIGYFNTVAEANMFGQYLNSSMNSDYWVDNKTNDHVGDPNAEFIEPDNGDMPLISEGTVEPEPEEYNDLPEDYSPAQYEAPPEPSTPSNTQAVSEPPATSNPDPADDYSAPPTGPSQPTNAEEDWASDEEWSTP